MAEQRGGDSHVSDKVLCQLLNELDGIEARKQVLIVGATNRPDILDKALIRPGRFDRLIYIPPPDYEARYEIFQINIKRLVVHNDVNCQYLAQATENFSGAEINMACREAGMLALSEDIDAQVITKEHFTMAIKGIKPVISQEMKDYFTEFATNNK